MARSAPSLAIGALGVVIAFAIGMRALAQRADAGAIDPDDPCMEMGECEMGEVGFLGEAEETRLGADTCRNAGYLCSGLRERAEPRLIRWASETREIRVRVLAPEFERQGRQLQSAAIAGILSWSENPFPIRILRTAQGEADFEVVWHASLGGNTLGTAYTQWFRGQEGSGMRVDRLDMATRVPGRSGQLLDAASVRLTAAHEMGHALGLPHSDNRRDVMFPSNTANRLSAGDFETMRALYGLPNGALVELPPR